MSKRSKLIGLIVLFCISLFLFMAHQSTQTELTKARRQANESGLKVNKLKSENRSLQHKIALLTVESKQHVELAFTGAVFHAKSLRANGQLSKELEKQLETIEKMNKLGGITLDYEAKKDFAFAVIGQSKQSW